MFWNSGSTSASAKVDLVGTKVSGKSKASAAAKITGAPRESGRLEGARRAAWMQSVQAAAGVSRK